MNKLIQWLRGLKEWMEQFAEKPHAMWWLFILSFMESSFFPIPPDVLLIAIAVSNPKVSLKAALFCTLGSVLGGVFGYGIGFYAMDYIGMPILEFYGKEDALGKFMDLWREWGDMLLAGAAFTPIPYKVATIASGAAKMDLIKFVLISSIGRAGRFFIVGGLIYFAGPKMKDFIDKHFDRLSLVFLFLLIGGFLAIKYLL